MLPNSRDRPTDRGDRRAACDLSKGYRLPPKGSIPSRRTHLEAGMKLPLSFYGPFFRLSRKSEGFPSMGPWRDRTRMERSLDSSWTQKNSNEATATISVAATKK